MIRCLPVVCIVKKHLLKHVKHVLYLGKASYQYIIHMVQGQVLDCILYSFLLLHWSLTTDIPCYDFQLHQKCSAYSVIYDRMKQTSLTSGFEMSGKFTTALSGQTIFINPLIVHL